MDRSLDEIISERPSDRRSRPEPRSEPRRAQPTPRGPRRAREEYPRDGIRKIRYDDRQNIDSEWVHDRYDADRDQDRGRMSGRPHIDRYDAASIRADSGAKLRVDNIHYELTEPDLRELFERIGPIVSIKLMYDRMDRSTGTAFVTYDDPRDAKDAITEYNGCNANGQPIRITTMPSAPAAASRGSLFERVERPSRSLFDRIEGPVSRDDSREGEAGRRRRRSHSPGRRPTPENIDRYVPGSRRHSRSPVRRRGTPRESGRRPGQRREDSGRGAGRPARKDDDGPPMVGGRPKKTAEELDAEMADYWGKKSEANGDAEAQNGSGAVTHAAVALPADEDVDMIE